MWTYAKSKYLQWTELKSKTKEKNVALYHVMDLAEAIVVALVLALLIKHFILQTSVVPTGSMIPTLKIKDRLLVNKFIYRFREPKRAELVVFRSPKGDKKDYVKRCIGLPGETIEIRKGMVYINGELAVIPGATIQRDYSYFGPITLPENAYFMLGDNRSNSYDSRFWEQDASIGRSYVPEKDLLGKAFFTFWPLSRMRILR